MTILRNFFQHIKRDNLTKNKEKHLKTTRTSAQRETSNRIIMEGQMEALHLISQKCKSIIDIGCGPGNQSYYFYNQDLSVIAVDDSPESFNYQKIEDIPSNKLPADAVFASHVLEHCPDTAVTLQKWRSLIRDGGYLFIFVPAYQPYTVDEHCHIGWTLAQLSMTLVANGFDCQNSIFKIFPGAGAQLFGYGVKRDFPSSEFSIIKSSPYLPSGLTKEIRNFNPDDLYLPGNLTYIDSSTVKHTIRHDIVEAPILEVLINPEYKLLPSNHWQDIIFPCQGNLANGKFYIYLVVHTSVATPLRVALICEKLPYGENANSHVLELWQNFTPGVHALIFLAQDLEILCGSPDISHVQQVVLGGMIAQGEIHCSFKYSPDGKE